MIIPLEEMIARGRLRQDEDGVAESLRLLDDDLAVVFGDAAGQRVLRAFFALAHPLMPRLGSTSEETAMLLGRSEFTAMITRRLPVVVNPHSISLPQTEQNK